MSEAMPAKGRCLCGAVRITVKNLSKNVGACHCNLCRKWGGGPLMAVDCGADVSFEGEENISVFNSSAWAERGFCNKCGSHLFYRLKANNQHIMPVGLFDDEDQFVFDHQVFIDEKPSFYCFSNETHDMTGAELFAKFAPPS
ncbi:MAG: GFA family protein [Leptolyngbyaceae cyanobacterium MO_188.B28]|nr:GFA family protein [Leptolyngbyaceae cyanobacterium MO_188.B28]